MYVQITYFIGKVKMSFAEPLIIEKCIHLFDIGTQSRETRD